MTSNGVESQPVVLWQITSPGARRLARESARFEDLQTVLRCCERLLPAVIAAASAADPGAEEALVESLWTTALLSYGRCFAVAEGVAANDALGETEVAEALPDNEQVVEWHRALLSLRDHYADGVVNPRETFAVGLARLTEGVPPDEVPGGAAGIAITSARQPSVDEVTVRNTGALAYALSTVVDGRISAQQEAVFAEVKDRPAAELDAFPPLEATRTD